MAMRLLSARAWVAHSPGAAPASAPVVISLSVWRRVVLIIVSSVDVVVASAAACAFGCSGFCRHWPDDTLAGADFVTVDRLLASLAGIRKSWRCSEFRRD